MPKFEAKWEMENVNSDDFAVEFEGHASIRDQLGKELVHVVDVVDIDACIDVDDGRESIGEGCSEYVVCVCTARGILAEGHVTVWEK